MAERELTGSQWERLRPVLPPQKPRTGRPANDHRPVPEGILWIPRPGAPWRDLPARFGSRGAVSSRFYRWQQTGVWDRLLAAPQAEADADGRLDRTLHFVDGTMVRAHRHAAGPRGATATPRRSAAAAAAFRPRSTSGRSGGASRWSSP